MILQWRACSGGHTDLVGMRLEVMGVVVVIGSGWSHSANSYPHSVLSGERGQGSRQSLLCSIAKAYMYTAYGCWNKVINFKSKNEPIHCLQ